VPGPPDQVLQSPYHGVARKAAPRKCEIGGRRTVESAESSYSLGPETLRSPLGPPHETVQLIPMGLSFVDETF
jgi:hypothetical protein